MIALCVEGRLNINRSKLNLFALPSQTTLLFAGILFVIGLPLVLNLFSRYGLRFPLLGVVVILFTLWDFLSEPDRVIERQAGTPLPPATLLAKQVAALADEVRMRPPTLLTTDKPLAAPYVFGTWRRRYMMFPAWLVVEWPKLMQEKAHTSHLDVVLRHELAHFLNHDVWLTGFARSLLKMTVIVLVAYWFALLWEPVVYSAVRPFWDQVMPYYAPLIHFLPAEVQPLVLNPPARTWTAIVVDWLEVTMSLLPLAGGALVLWWRDWNLLTRVREVYADARVANWRADIASLEGALTWFRAHAMSAKHEPDQQRRWPARFRRSANQQPLSWSLDMPVRVSLRILPQPKQSTRRLILRQPELVYGSPSAIGRQAAVIVLLFYLINASLLGVASAGIGSEVALGVGFVVLALGLTPGVLANMPEKGLAHRNVLQTTAVYLGIFNAILAIFLLVAVAAVLFQPQDLDLVMYAIAGVTPTPGRTIIADPAGYIFQVVAGAFIVFMVAAPLLLYLWLRLDLAIKRRMLSWGGAPWLARRAHWLLLGVTALLVFALLLGVLPLLTLLAFPGIFIDATKPLLTTLTPILVQMVVAILVLVVAGIAFYRCDRRYGRRCPGCGQPVPPPDQLTATCPHCGARLLEWLTARY